jgi:hypothetical protein
MCGDSAVGIIARDADLDVEEAPLAAPCVCT